MSTYPLRLAWRQGKPAPVNMTSYWGAAVAHDNTAYFSQNHDIYSYTILEDKWNKLEPCSYECFSMAVIDDHKLTTIGGCRNTTPTNNLLCLSGSSSEMKWKIFLPPMPTRRIRPAVVTTPTHLVVAGGKKRPHGTPFMVSRVEVLNLHTLQWASASGSPQALEHPSMTLCGEHVYLCEDKTIFSCSVEELIKSAYASSSTGDSVWTRLTDTPTYCTTLATLRGRALTIGGSGDQYSGIIAGTIHRYNTITNSWSVIGEMPTRRHATLVAVLPSSNELVVVGGYGSEQNSTPYSIVTEIVRGY